MSERWPKVRVGEVLRRSTGVADISPDAEYQEITVKLWGKGVVRRGIVSGASLAGSRRFLAKAGQFVASRIDARNGALGIVPAELCGAVVTNDFPTFDLDRSRIEPGYLEWLSRTADFVALCRHASEGTTNRVRLKEERFLDLEILLPPLEEQRRIAARIEELAAKVAEARGLRRGAVVEGEALSASLSRTTFDDIDADHVELQDVCEAIIDNLHSNPRYSDAGVPCIRSPDVGWGALDLDRALRTDEEEYRRRTVRGEPRTDDIVFVREGGGTGKAALVLPEQRFSLGQRVMMLRPDKRKVLPKYFLYQMLSPVVQEDQIRPLTKGSASPHLNIGALRRFTFRLAPISVQSETVEMLDGFLAKLKVLKHQQAETAAELEALLPSILYRAFQGEL